MKNSKSRVIALSAISAAFALVLLVLGSYIEVLDLSCLFMASLALMLPLAKGYRMGGFLAYLASALLAFILTGMRLQVLIPFAMFFGLHPLANDIQRKYKINVILATAIKAAWFIATLFVMYYFTSMFIVEHEVIKQYINYVLVIGGGLVFIVYDWFMVYFQRAINSIVARLKL